MPDIPLTTESEMTDVQRIECSCISELHMFSFSESFAQIRGIHLLSN